MPDKTEPLRLTPVLTLGQDQIVIDLPAKSITVSLIDGLVCEHRSESHAGFWAAPGFRHNHSYTGPERRRAKPPEPEDKPSHPRVCIVP